MNARGIFAIILNLLLSHILCGQLPYRTSRISVDNGLSQNSVWDVLQDDQGYMWVGTAGGVDRWDGVNFTHYQHNPADSASISGTTGFRFYVDQTGSLWITHNKGVTLYNYITGRMENLLRVNFTCVLLGEWKGRIHILSGPAEITQVDIESGKISKSKIRLNGYSYSNEDASPFAAQCGPWMFLSNRDSAVSVYHAESGSVKVFNFSERVSFPFVLNESTVAVMCKDSLTLWRCTGSETIVSQKCVPGMKGHYILTGLMHKGLLWTCGQEGIFLIDTLNWRMRFHYKAIDPVLNQTEFVYNLKHDRSGNLLICSNISGFFILSDSRNRFPVYQPVDARTTIVKGIAVWERTLFTGQFDGGLTVFQSDTSYTVPSLSGKKEPESIWGIHVLDSSRLIAVTDQHWVVYNWKSKQVVKRQQYTPYYQLNFPFFIQEKRGGWVNLNSQSDGGIYHFNEEGELDTLLFLRNVTITGFQFMPDSSLLIGTMEELFHYNNGVKRTILSDVWVKSICKTSDGELYCATTSGCYVLGGDLKMRRMLTTDQGMPDNFVYSVLEDEEGSIWMSTNKGIACYDPETASFRKYTVDDGLQSNEFNTGAYYKAADGTLYFGGVRGVNRIDPHALFQNETGAKTIMSRIMVGDQDWRIDTAYNMVRLITLPYWNSTVSFDFSGGEFSMPERNVYRFRLEPYDEDWISSGTRHFARYANLAPGEYIFKVQSANADGIWGPEKWISITVVPPFWQRTWFYVLEIVTCLLLMSLIVFWIRRRQQKRWQREIEIVQRLEKERIRISRDLHDHVGAQLSYVIAGLDHMTHHPEEWKDEKVFRSKLEKLSSFGRDAMLTLRETIWAISSAKLTVEDFSDRFKQYILRVMDMDPGVHVEFNEDLRADAILTPERSLGIFRICQEAFHNSIKHSGADRIRIKFESDASLFRFIIEDNGKGFTDAESIKEGHYGLLNMRTRAEEMGGVIHISSERGEGTSITLEVPLNGLQQMQY